MFDIFTKLSDLTEKIKIEFKMGDFQASAVAVGVYYYSIAFSMAMAGILGFAIPLLPKNWNEALIFLTKGLIMLVVLAISLRLGPAVGKAYSTNQVLLFSMMTSILSGRYVQKMASKFSLIFGLVMGMTLSLIGVGVSTIAILVFRNSLGIGMPALSLGDITFLSILAMSLLVNILTLVIPGLTSDTLSEEQIRKFALYKMLEVAMDAAEKDIRNTPGVGLHIILGLAAVPDGWKESQDAKLLQGLNIEDRRLIVAAVRNGGKFIVRETDGTVTGVGVTQPGTTIPVKSKAESE